MKRRYLYIPLALFLVLAGLLLWQLTRNAQGEAPTDLESALIGKPVPVFRLESLEQPGKVWGSEVLADGKPLLLNVWATWCPTCRAEHKFLNGLSAQGIRVVGMNYKDDRNKAIGWLRDLGNPYMLSLFDGNGMLGLDLGVYGAPETFLIDGKGIIRYRHAGDLNDRVWREELKPLWDKYSQEAGS
ncbi:DsbE family thiol:disulfide interchange protein [Cedecea davisae]|uniref:Thiol:disulfide interchange protein DsbE n=1 Tax=Cedecea davisae TaxID=158484 RepID=A0ABS6DJ57_9ENTR|nr:DsbE family thiol:disulfide interchange protein [Cedecea davisae]MBU4683242.1 DsbE family thiol:disulfide interchange protein [Cedecea davisae]MBU4686706.1 DsbE family thiol:disulfide interchange protein [Cedecea davisae]